jgi:RNA polymerase sigma factor (TIGR02999 family)
MIKRKDYISLNPGGGCSILGKNKARWRDLLAKANALTSPTSGDTILAIACRIPSMENTSPQSLTQLLKDASAGKQGAVNALFPIVYAEMRRLAASYLRRERPGHTLQSTALVHEAYLRLVDQNVSWQNRAHFLGIAAQTMRRILMDHAKRRGAGKRGGGQITLQIDESVLAGKNRDLNLIALDRALSELEKVDPIRSKIVEMRFFGGLSNEEAAEVLGVSAPTVQRQWAGARAWLFQRMKNGEAR